MTTKNVGVIGLGAMGLGIAKTLRNNGYNAVSYTHLTLPTTPYV